MNMTIAEQLWTDCGFGSYIHWIWFDVMGEHCHSSDAQQRVEVRPPSHFRNYLLCEEAICYQFIYISYDEFL